MGSCDTPEPNVNQPQKNSKSKTRLEIAKEGVKQQVNDDEGRQNSVNEAE
jgi:hypothetical protein